MSDPLREDAKESKSDEDTDIQLTKADAASEDSKTASVQWLREHHGKEWMDEWTRAGLSRYVDLPMICVLGDTSSGKSSVLSSLIGLELPSASTLTTKCPVLIQMQHATQHRATIDIQWHTSKPRPDPLESPRERKRSIEKQVEDRHQTPAPTKDNHTPKDIAPPPPPPPKWLPRTFTSSLDTVIPECIQEAQQTILQFRDTLVAPDVICVTLWSPFCTKDTELTLVDLPGLVQFQHQHDVSILSQVEQVVLEYVQNPRSILLPVVAAHTNLHNSKVLQWAKQVDPDSKRTVPVLTKPDLMDPGSETDVVELLMQNIDSSSTESDTNQPQFHHGFYLVKNRGQALLDAGATLEEGLQAEHDYFSSTLPWNAIAEPRLGIAKLRTKLAHVLWQVMQECLPDILKELRQQYEETQEQLDDMGTLYHTRSDQRKYYHSLSQQVVSQVASSLSGKGGRPGTSRKKFGDHSAATSTKASGASRLHAACRVFYQEIRDSTLASISRIEVGSTVLVSSLGTQEDVQGEIVHMDEEGKIAYIDYCEDKDHTMDVLFDGVGYESEQPDFADEEVWTDGSRVFIGRTNGKFDSLRPVPLNRIRTDPSWLSERMEEFRTDDLACFVNVDMFQQVVAEFVQQDWAPPCQELVNTLEQILKESLDHSLQQHLETTRFPLLRTMMESTCHRVAEQMLKNARTQVHEHLELEEQHPYTHDEILLQAMNQSRFRSLRNDLEMQLRLDQEGVVYDTQAIRTILDRVFAKHQRNKWMAEQMELAIGCYGQVATQRALDRTPQICWQTCRSLAKSIQDELGCVTDDVLETCLWESPESRQQYQDLTNKLHDLQKAMDVVESIR